jgi:hypothetical protein
MFYEKEVSSLPGLRKALRVLDEDSGVRLIGELEGKQCMAFVTRFGSKYTMMTYSVKGTSESPGRRLRTSELGSADAAAEALRKLSPRRLRAYVY